MSGIAIDVQTGAVAPAALSQPEIDEIAARAADPVRQAATIKAQILDAEMRALNTGFLRCTREFMLTLFKLQAAQAGITEAMLLDPEHPAYSDAYAKMHALDATCKALREML